MSTNAADKFFKILEQVAQYVRTEYKFGGDIKWVVEHFKMKILKLPKEVDGNASDTIQEVCKHQITEYVKREMKLEVLVTILYRFLLQ